MKRQHEEYGSLIEVRNPKEIKGVANLSPNQIVGSDADKNLSSVLWANADLSDYCDGSTNTFNIGAVPIANSTLLIRNSASTVEGYGYEVSGSNIVTEDNPPAGTILVCKFQYLI